MIARIVLLSLLAVALSKTTYNLEEISEVYMQPGEKVVIEYIPKSASAGKLWVIGRFPSNRIIPEEGRLGDRYNDRVSEFGTLIQSWTIANLGGSPGDEFVMNFWYLNPQYAEMYYNEPEAYEEMFEEKVITKDIRFILAVQEL